MIRILLAAAILLAVVPPAHAQSISQAAAGQLRLDEILASAPFSPQERSALIKGYENIARSAPDGLSKNGSTVAKFLALYDRVPPKRRADLVTKVRRGIELQPCAPTPGTLCATEMPMIRAHDPVILIDRARKLVFTRASIAALVAGAHSIAGRLNVAPPGSDAPDLIAAQLRARDAQGQTAAFDVMQDAASYNFDIPQWNRAAPQSGVDKIHRIIAAQNSEASRVFFLSQAAALGGKGGRAVDAARAAGGQMGAMQGEAMRRAVRAGSPSCMGPGTGSNYGFCSGAY